MAATSIAPTTNNVILVSPEQWTFWYRQTKKSINPAIWRQYINLDGTVPLEQPIQPKLPVEQAYNQKYKAVLKRYNTEYEASVKAWEQQQDTVSMSTGSTRRGASTVTIPVDKPSYEPPEIEDTPMDVLDFQRYQFATSQYDRQRREYDHDNDKLQKVTDLLLKTIGLQYQQHLAEHETVRSQLLALKEAVQPNEMEQARYSLDYYNKLYILPRNKAMTKAEITVWLNKWVTGMAILKNENFIDAKEKPRWFSKLVDTIRYKDDIVARLLDATLSTDTNTTFRGVADFIQRSWTESSLTVPNSRRGAYAATFGQQGNRDKSPRRDDDEKEPAAKRGRGNHQKGGTPQPKNDCPACERHNNIDRCFYIHESKRPSTFIRNEKFDTNLQQIEAIIDKNSQLKKLVKESKARVAKEAGDSSGNA